jgi:predicted RNA binding protein YcfA (HicA-like mRNA interferase family)
VPLKVSEIIKMIEADGRYLAATKGSHRQYKHRLGSRPARSDRRSLVLR